MKGGFPRTRFLYRALRARLRDQRFELGVALSVIREGDSVVDVGANKGSYLYWLRRAVGPGGRVFAFEPQPQLKEYLDGVVSVMGWKNVEVRNVALSDRPGTLDIYVPGKPGDASPSASLEKHVVEQSDYHAIRCQVDTLDNLVLDKTTVSFIKCDVEGHELSVFKGAAGILKRDAPALLFECEARHLGSHSMSDVFDFLHSLGYTGSFFGGNGLRPIGEFSVSLHQQQLGARFWDSPAYYNNFFFCKGRPAWHTRG